MTKDVDYLPEQHETVDPWHLHTPREGRAQPEHASHVNTTLLGVAFLVIVGSVVLVVALIIVYFNSYSATVRARRVETLDWAVESSASKQAKVEVLDAGGQVGEGVRFKPIERAMGEVVRDYADSRADAN